MAEPYKHIYKVDLNQQLVRRDVGLLATYNNKANRFCAELYQNNEEIDTSGCSVVGYFMRPNGETLRISGVASGNMVYVTLNANCYFFDGAFTLALNVSKGEFEQTVLLCDGILGQTRTEHVVTTENIVPSMAHFVVGNDQPSDTPCLWFNTAPGGTASTAAVLLLDDDETDNTIQAEVEGELYGVNNASMNSGATNTTYDFTVVK